MDECVRASCLMSEGGEYGATYSTERDATDRYSSRHGGAMNTISQHVPGPEG